MSTPTVKAIDRRSVHQICSGQVVVTLSTALKELVENSLDAGATNIEIRLKNFGADSVEVIDNGSGVLPENFQALALKHHTSKLNVFSDLVGVETFGFRGEALSSLCALSDLSITTCHLSKSIGTRIEYNHDGQITKQNATARVPGTTVTLYNLFSTLPVRHKEFLRNLKREYAKLVQVLQSYCVISTGVRFSCHTQSEKGKKNLVLSTNGNAEMRENISNVFGPKQLQTVVEFKQVSPKQEDCEEQGLDIAGIDEDPIFCLTGYVSRGDHGAGRSTTDRQFIFINKRPCDLPKVIRLVNEVYHGFNRNQYPFVALNISLNKELVDVNVTPDKRQVFLQQEKVLLATIKSSLKSMFDPGTSSYQLNEKPLTQIKLGFSKLKDEGDKSAFSKSIKERLLLANATTVCKEKKRTSILNYTDTKQNSDVDTPAKTPLIDGTNDLKFEVEQHSNCLKKDDENEEYTKASRSVREETTIIENVEVGETDRCEVEELQDCNENDETNAISEAGDSFQGRLKIDSKCGTKSTGELKRKFETHTEDGSPEGSTHTTHKKIRLDDDCVKGMDTTNRKNITVKFDWQKLGTIEKNRERSEQTSNNARSFRATIAPENNQSAEEELGRHITKEMFGEMEIIGQFNQGFIISKLKNDLFIIDQHASDEKYNFEDQQKNTVIKSQRLICPQALDLTAVNESILLENIEVFRKNGFDFHVDEEAAVTERVKLVSSPVSKNWSFGKPDIDELIFMLSDNPGVSYRPSNVQKMFASRACRMSIMVGTSLNRAQMTRIVNHMGEMEHPWNCPHGRPTMRHLINLNMIRK